MRALLLSAALLAPGSAWAATRDIGCIEAKLGPAVMQRIGDGVVAAADKGGDLASALDVDRDALLAAREACRTANNWSPDATQAAVSYTQARATKLGAESVLKRDGLDASELAANFAALPIEDRESLLAKPSQGAINAIKVVSPRAAVRRHAYLYLAAIAAIKFYPSEFATS